MDSSLRISILFLSIIVLIAGVSAYDSFFIVEETDSGQAVIIHDLDSSEVIGEGGTIIKLIKAEGDFSDLYEYIKNSPIEIVLLYGNDDLLEFGTNLRQATGVNVMVKFAKSARERTSWISAVEPLERGISSVYQSQDQETLIQEEPSENVEYIETTEVTTESTPIQIPPGNNQPVTGDVVSEKRENTNNLLLSSLIIGLAIIIGFVILSFVMRKRGYSK
jgi:hypothetical protein